MPAPIATAPTVPHVSMLGLGVYRPRRVVPNSEIVDKIDSTDEWIQTRSGIVSRRWADDDETIVSMATAAARDAIEAAGLSPEDIDAVVLATSSQMVLGPSAAAIVATELGLYDAAAYDVAAGCSGFCYALGTASSIVRAGQAKNALVIGVEKLTDLVDEHDRTTAFIFADGAGAAVVGPSETEGLGPMTWGSDGEQTRAIKQDKDFQQYFEEVRQAAGTGEAPERPYVRMDGRAVFRWALTFLEKACRDTLDKAGLEAKDLDAFVPHQANNRIIDALVGALGLPEDIAVARDIIESGNTSAASVPMAMEQVLRTGGAKPGDTAMILGFGAGLAYAGQIVTLPPIKN
ncbi:MAG: ketoacyl-ACP synthase III [Rhodococcus sp.]|nr:ketoacyl-ACP synthase III [Rhodococcus sp. (in: high G+C Gram-positive bacteria)]